MNIPAELIPPFMSPLTHDQHARLGRISILWGQIDMVLDQLLQVALNITGEQRQALIGDRPIGGKLDLLKNNANGITNKTARSLALEFWDLTNQTKLMRNKCFHGVWGLHLGRNQSVTPAASHYKEMENPVKVTQLPALEKKLCKTARCGWNALTILNGMSGKSNGCSRLFHGKGDTPAWLPEWIERNPKGDHILDRRYKAGQLPYPAKPL